MSEIKQQIAEINKAAKKSRRINNILWLLVVLLVGLAFYLAFEAVDAKQREETAKNEAIDAREEAKQNAEEAKQAKEELEQSIQKSREVLWENATNMNTIDAYSYYVDIYGTDDIHFDEVQEAMKNLFKDEGYVQLVDSNGRDEYFKPKPESKLGTFYYAVTDRNVNTGVLGSSDFPNAGDKLNHSIRQGQVVQILENFTSGNAKWAKVGYTNRR